MDPKRILSLNNQSTAPGDCVVYVMSRDQRVADNHALLCAQRDALSQKLPLVVFFVLMPKHGVRAREHFAFMLDGLEEVARDLKKLNIPFVAHAGDQHKELEKFARTAKPAAVYFDFSPLREPRALQKTYAAQAKHPCHVVDTHNIIPLWCASDKQEFAAHTFRHKVHAHLEEFLVEPEKIKKHPHRFTKKVASHVSFRELRKKIEKIEACGITPVHEPGEKAARKTILHFTRTKLKNYAHKRNDPVADGQSELSPYLHFGQIASLRVALHITKHVKKKPLLFTEPRMAQAGDMSSEEDGMNALLEEMIVRKELSDNYCFYNRDYDSLNGAPRWALDTLANHEKDERDYVYTKKQWEDAQTHDPAWNAAQNQLRKTGKMHGYMRMYWAKKILEWSKNPKEAHAIALYLNDHYSLDGGDPNGFVGVLWSIAGLHDRPWSERDVFGKIRFMNAAGLKRKFDIDAYCQRWNNQTLL